MHVMIVISLAGLHMGAFHRHLTSPLGLNKSKGSADQIRRQAEKLLKSAPGTHNTILTRASIVLIMH